jgi:uncharacterized low-complexity protein
MSITTKKTTITLAASAALSAGLALSPMMASADSNPFLSNEMTSGYMHFAEGHKTANEGKCGEAKCGAEKKATHEATCGAEKKAAHEAKCGAEKTDKMEEGTCGAKK